MREQISIGVILIIGFVANSVPLGCEMAENVIGIGCGLAKRVLHGHLLAVLVIGVTCHPMATQYFHPFGHLWIIGDDHSTFAGGHILVGVEGEDGDAGKGADSLTFVFGPHGVGRVFDDQ